MRARRCRCGVSFQPRSRNHKSCPGCRLSHRKGKRCDSLLPCDICERVFARLAAFNERKRNGEVLDRRRGVDIVCPTCGITYAAFRSGFSFTDARRDFITDDPNRKTGAPRRHGRRHGVLGKMREWKQLAWNAHVDQCASVAAEGAA